MKVQSALLAAAAASASAAPTALPAEISAASPLGRDLLSRARRLDGGEDEDATTWIAGYSLKFQGCRHHASLNLDADGDDDVKVQTSKLAHFRLCPASSCEGWLGGGCSKNYGDYVVDLASFAQAHVEGARRSREYACQMYMYENCDCQENDDKDDGWDREYCEYDCYSGSKKFQDCVDRNPYEDDEQEDRDRRFEAQEYTECKEWELPEYDDDDANDARRLEDAGEEEVQYYIGPYCSADGGSVFLGLYTDDTCTNFADDTNGKSTYKTLSRGEDLPYSSTSIVTSDCVACVEQEDPNRQDEQEEDGEEEEIRLSEQCERLYESAGKCESAINAASAGMTSEPNTAACSYIGGIQFTKVNGIVEMKTSKMATFWICAFAAVFVGLAGVVFRLRKDIQEAKSSPLLAKEDSQEDQALS